MTWRRGTIDRRFETRRGAGIKPPKQRKQSRFIFANPFRLIRF
jgi:hypothetical protein